jgi:hypothetical protein
VGYPGQKGDTESLLISGAVSAVEESEGPLAIIVSEDGAAILPHELYVVR